MKNDQLNEEEGGTPANQTGGVDNAENAGNTPPQRRKGAVDMSAKVKETAQNILNKLKK